MKIYLENEVNDNSEMYLCNWISAVEVHKI